MRCRRHEFPTWGVIGVVGVTVAAGVGAYFYFLSPEENISELNQRWDAKVEEFKQASEEILSPGINSMKVEKDDITLEVAVGDGAEDPPEAFT